jgi:predicted aspartyl protease
LRSTVSLYGFAICFLGSLLLSFSGDIPKSNAYKNAGVPTEVIHPQLINPLYLKQSQIAVLYSPDSLGLIPPDTSSFVIPLRRIGRLFVMEATIDGVSGNLIFDTGATTLVLNRTYFRDHVSSGELSSSGITGSVGQVDKVTAGDLQIDKLKFKNQPAHLADLGHIENQRGIKVLGLFGFELIRSFEIHFDVVNGRLILNPMDKKGNLLDLKKQFTPDFTQSFEMSNNVVFVKALVGGKSLRFCLDTGAETNALNSDLNKSILQTVSITHTVKLKGAGSVSREVIYGIMNNFQCGDTLINNMQTIITYLDHLSDAFGIHVDGVLGFDFISKANFCINFAKGTMGVMYINQAEP